MHKRFLQILALAVCLGLLPAHAYAKGGPPAGKGRDASEHGDKDKDKHHDEDRDNDRDEHRAGKGHDHDHDREAAEGPSSRPKGWSEGKKVGWGDCNVPPGLAKKRGCDSSGLSTRERALKAHGTTTHRTTSTVTTAKPTTPSRTTTAAATTGKSTTSKTTTTTAQGAAKTRAQIAAEAEAKRKGIEK